MNYYEVFLIQGEWYFVIPGEDGPFPGQHWDIFVGPYLTKGAASKDCAKAKAKRRHGC